MHCTIGRRDRAVLAAQHVAAAERLPDAERGRVPEDRAHHLIALLRLAEAREDHAGARFFHADLRVPRVRRAEAQQLLDGKAHGLRAHVIHIAAELQNGLLAFHRLAQERADGRKLRKVFLPHAAACTLQLHRRKIAKILCEMPKKRSARRGAELALHVSGEARQSLQELCRRGRGDRKLTVRGVHRAEARAHGARHDALHTEQPHQAAGGTDIRNGVHHAELMEVHLLHRHTMDGALRGGDAAVDGRDLRLDTVRQAQSRKDLHHIRQAAGRVRRLGHALFRPVDHHAQVRPCKAVARDRLCDIGHARDADGIELFQCGITVRKELQERCREHIARSAGGHIQIQSLHFLHPSLLLRWLIMLAR